MKLYFSTKTNVIGLVLIALMIRASFWQWERYNWKLGLIKKVDANLTETPVALDELVKASADWSTLLHRRVLVEGEYDYEHEMVLQNRKHEDQPGVFVITPLKIKANDSHILVNRGFIPFADAHREDRIKYRKEGKAEFQGLIKESVPRKMFAPEDQEAGAGHPWVDWWLRIDLPNMEKQLPYPILPVFLEIVGDKNADFSKISSEIFKSSAGKEELFFLPSRVNAGEEHKHDLKEYPIPVFDTVVPPGRHLGYVYEWAAMAVMTALICLAIQLTPRTRRKN